MLHKKTNLCVAADVTTQEKLFELIDNIGPHICILKLHIDILEDFDESVINKLKYAAEAYNFLLFEDRKFADIGNTVYNQFTKGVYKISEWADMVTVHITPGPGILDGLKKNMNRPVGFMLLAQMSSKGNLLGEDYVQKSREIAQEYTDCVLGFICQEKISDGDFIHMTPGVKLGDTKDTLGQQYNSPEYVITQKGTDIIIVGRGVRNAPNQKEAAIKYQTEGWNALLKKIS